MITKGRIFIILTLAVYIVLGGTDMVFAAHDEERRGADGNAEWGPFSAGPVTTWTAPLCGKGKLIIQPFFFYNRTRGTFNGEGHYKSFKNDDSKSQWQEQLFMQLGVTDRLEIAGQGVYQQNSIHKDGDSAHAAGFGDSYAYARYCLIEEGSYIPHLTALFQLKLPTGKYEKADPGKLGADLMGATTGGGSYDHGYGLNITKKLKPFVFHGDFIYNIPIETKIDGVKTRYADYANYDFGVEYFLPMGFNLVVECNGIWQGDKKKEGESIPDSDINSLVIVPGVGWSCEKIQTLFAYQRTLAGTNVDVNDSFVFTFVYMF